MVEYTGDEPLLWVDCLDFNQVPEAVLKAMSTEGVIETCLSYPLARIRMGISNQSFYAGFLNICEDYNGVRELFKREDAGSKLSEFYKGISLANMQLVYNGEPYYDISGLMFLEYLIAHEQILSKMTAEERKSVIETSLKLEKEKEELPGTFFSNHSVLLVLRIAYINNTDFTEYVDNHEALKNALDNDLLGIFSAEEIQEFLNYTAIS